MGEHESWLARAYGCYYESSGGLAALATLLDNHATHAKLYFTPIYGKANMLKTLIANSYPAMQYVKDTSERFRKEDCSALLLRSVRNKIVPSPI